MKPYVVACIFARGGSKGLPGKNIRPLAGKPLLAYPIETARQSRHIDRIVVSTDDDAIAEVALKYGAEVPFRRPAEFATDTASERLAWRHAVNTLEAEPGARKIDAFVSIPTTCPLRTVDDVDRCIELLLATDSDVVVTATEAQRHPMYTMLAPRTDGTVGIFMPPPGQIVRRQDAPPALDLVAVCYAMRTAYVRERDGVIDGRVRAVIVPQDHAVDIDTAYEFELAEFLLARRTRLAAQP